MADWTLPTETSQYLQVLANLKDRDVNAATWGEGGYVNPPRGALRFDRASGHPYVIQEWDEVAWQNRIISVASGGTGATNLNDFKASLGLGSMAYQNASTVAITGGSINDVNIAGASTIDTTSTPNFRNGAVVYTHPNGTTIGLAGRLTDNYSSIIFYNSALSEWGRLYVDRISHLWSTMHIIPHTTNVCLLGTNGYSWANVWSTTVYASSVGGGGYLLDAVTNFGFYYSQPHGALAMNSAAASGLPAIMVPHTSSSVMIGGDIYPYTDRTGNCGIAARYWGMVSSVWHNAPGEGGFIFTGTAAYGLLLENGVNPHMKSGNVSAMAWASSLVHCRLPLYLPQQPNGVGSLYNDLTQSNFMSFHSVGFSVFVANLQMFSIYNNNVVAVEQGARLYLSPDSSSDSYLKMAWSGNSQAGMGLDGGAQATTTAVWHFNIGAARLINMHYQHPIFATPAIAFHHIMPISVDALWFGYSPYRWYSGWFVVAPNIGSDGRDKDILGQEKLGLNFINLLEPVMYRIPSLKWRDDNKRIWHGLVAQDVEKVLDRLGIDFAGLEKANDDYGLRYTEFIGPIIRAIQELDRKVEDAKAQFLARK